MPADFQVFLRTCRIVALTERARSYMHDKTATFTNTAGHTDMIVSAGMLSCCLAELLHDGYTAQDGRGKPITDKRLRAMNI
jgi:hypothetical protein